MTVTDIIPVSAGKGRGTGGKYRVFIEGQLAFVLYRGELSRYGIEKDCELSEQAYDEILGEVLYKRARLRCMHLLESADKTEAQLRMKLQQGEYPKEVIESTIEWLIQKRYLDDERYADMYIEYNKEKKSRRQIEMELQRKGISGDKIENAFTGQELAAEDDLIREWLDKKHYDRENADAAAQRKMYGFLMRKGFSSPAVMKALRDR
ncbi:regulatory protein RecX [Murimonas intestini]|uniref:Regulatory protein RecX n=1 Tax=Murimonas intestini TaxID=1337051 RepID=A0AB73T4R4_9FIRM|nr:regulatory protein RecX [Murimonas intestini]MCR1840599.1 recombination regulator RecX [Murimonas intestini]MCR1865348.1 recombination regulator RecX [Murimonas intestini]MCR1882941.1 recombination regulator RecX [Murimonas intestini]